MTRKKTTEDARILAEMLELAQSLDGHGLIAKQDMARMNLICQSPPQYTSKAATFIGDRGFADTGRKPDRH